MFSKEQHVSCMISTRHDRTGPFRKFIENIYVVVTLQRNASG